MKTEEKQRIEKDAEEFIHKNVFGNEKYVTTVSPKGCYIAGATAERELMRKEIDAATDEAYEKGYKDATKEACEEIAKNYHPNTQ